MKYIFQSPSIWVYIAILNLILVRVEVTYLSYPLQTENVPPSPDPYYEPVVKLEPKTLDSLEHDEDELIKLYEYLHL